MEISAGPSPIFTRFLEFQREANARHAARQMALHKIVAAGLEVVTLGLVGRPATPEAIGRFRYDLAQYVGERFQEPFTLDLHVNDHGHLTVTADVEAEPESPAFELARKAALDEVAARVVEPETQDLTRADVALVGKLVRRPFVHIQGVLADLERWRAPPDVRNEEWVGYSRALMDFRRYLEAQAREASRAG